MSGRRALTFASMNDVMPEVDRLLEGYETVGRWSLGQTCNHLTTVILGSVEGFSGGAPWLVRVTIGKVVKRKVLRSGAMPTGIKLSEDFLPKPGLDDRAEAEALRAAIAQYASYTGPPALHPFFGAVTSDEWTRIHVIHAAHHLSFARPKAR